jgi:hypothetical protein
LRPIAVAILILIVVSIYAAPVSAANVTMTFNKGQLQAKMVLSVHQNMTDFPKETINLDASSDASMSAAFNAALRNVARSASFSTLTVGVSSNPTWLNLTITTNVAGMTERHGDVATANMTWRSFNVSSDLRAGDLSYNDVGSRYLRPVAAFYQNASTFETRPNATIKAVTFFVDGISVPGNVAANSVGNFTVLDFSSLSTPLAQWNRTYTLSNNTSSWRYTPQPLLNASLRVQTLNKTFTIFATCAYSAEITATGLVQTQGEVLLVDIGSGFDEWIMLGLVVLALVLATVAQIMYSRKKKTVKLGRR